MTKEHLNKGTSKTALNHILESMQEVWRKETIFCRFKTDILKQYQMVMIIRYYNGNILKRFWTLNAMYGLFSNKIQRQPINQ